MSPTAPADDAELLARARALLAGVAEPRPTPEELVAAARRGARTRAQLLRALVQQVDNLVARRRLAAGDYPAAFAGLRASLRQQAELLARGMPPPRPDPDDLVHAVFVKLHDAPGFRAAERPLGYAYVTLKRHVLDLIEAGAREVLADAEDDGGKRLPLADERPEAAPDRPRLPPDFMLRAGLDALERCLLTRVFVDGDAVPAAQTRCGGPPGEPYYVLRKLLARVAGACGLGPEETP